MLCSLIAKQITLMGHESILFSKSPTTTPHQDKINQIPMNQVHSVTNVVESDSQTNDPYELILYSESKTCITTAVDRFLTND